MENLYIFADFLKRARAKLDKTVATVAKETGASVSTVRQWEDSFGIVRLPKENKYAQICLAYGVEMEELKRIIGLVVEARRLDHEARLPRKRQQVQVFSGEISRVSTLSRTNYNVFSRRNGKS